MADTRARVRQPRDVTINVRANQWQRLRRLLATNAPWER